MGEISILLVEDEENVAKFVALELQFEGYHVKVAHDGEEALLYFGEREWDIILLDWMLPKLSGLEVCRRIRKQSEVPIILLTARDYIGDKIAGLDEGADDYVTKPFEIEELLARIRTNLRRNMKKSDNLNIYEVEDLMLDVRKRTVYKRGEYVELTQREFDLLHMLMNHEGEVLTRDRILSDVWGYDFIGQTNIVDVYIRYLRNKVDIHEDSRLIHTVRGVGYTVRKSEQQEIVK